MTDLTRLRRLLRWASLGVAVGLQLLWGLTGVVLPVDQWGWDHELSRQPVGSHSGRVVVVEIDDPTLDAIDESWPLSRTTWARLIEDIALERPAAISIAALFDQPADRRALTLAHELLAQLPESVGNEHVRDVLERARRDLDDESHLAVVISRLPVILGSVAVPLGSEASPDEHVFSASGDRTCLSMTQVREPVSQIRIAAYGMGTLNAEPDPDGVLRRYPLVVGVGPELYPSLALATWAQIHPHADLPTKMRELLTIDDGCPLLPVGDAQSIEVFSARAFIAGDAPDVEGAIVVLGVGATGIGPEPKIPGTPLTTTPRIQAQALRALLAGRLFRTSNPAPLLGALLTIIVMGTALVLVGRLSLLRNILAVIALSTIAALAAAVAQSTYSGMLLLLSPVLLGLGGLALSETAFRWLLLLRERRALQERERLARFVAAREQLLRTILESTNDVVIAYDSDRRVEWLNGAADRLFGGLEDNGRKICIDSLIPGLPDGTAWPVDEPVWHRELDGVMAEGGRVELSVTVTRAQEPTRTRFICVARDLARERAIQRLKNRFISLVTHELRTPVAAIAGSLDLILADTLGFLEAPVRETLEISRQSTERLRRLADQILDAESLESGFLSFEYTRCDLNELVMRTVQASASLTDEASVRLDVRIPATPTWGKVDEDRIVQVLTNLLSNAIKYSPTQGVIEIGLRDDEGPRFWVTDHGPGVPVELRPYLFQQFSRGDDEVARRRKGTGLGLSIARRIVELHGGRVGFESDLGRTTTFWFELPAMVESPSTARTNG